jgi:hypothetical protein
MAKQKKEYDAKIAGEGLSKLASLLTDHQICEDVAALDAAGQNCSKINDPYSWGYKFDFLDFKIDVEGKCMPKSLVEINLRFSIDIKGLIHAQSDIKNPLSRLKFNLELRGLAYNLDNDQEVEVFAAWHLDRHIREGGDGENKFSHPEYHLTFGGDKMREAKNRLDDYFDYGSSLIMPSPRIAYPPMDAVLGIDFIIQNYIHKSRRKPILEDPQYKTIVRRSQIALWKPYYTSIAAAWHKFDGLKFDTEYGFSKLMPFVLKETN